MVDDETTANLRAQILSLLPAEHAALLDQFADAARAEVAGMAAGLHQIMEPAIIRGGYRPGEEEYVALLLDMIDGARPQTRLGAPVVEYGEQMRGGGYHLRSLGEHVEAVYPLTRWIHDQQRTGVVVSSRIVIVVDDWREVPPTPAPPGSGRHSAEPPTRA